MSDVVELDNEPNDLAESDSTSTGETVSSEIPDELHTTLMSLENQDVLATEQTSDSDEQREGSDVEPATAESDTDYHETSLDKTTQRSGKPMPLATPSVTERPAQAQSSSQTALSTSLPPRTPLAAADDDEDAISSIFDTDDNALKHSPQHSSGWYTIVVFAGMVIVGVLGAVVFYYMTNNGF